VISNAIKPTNLPGGSIGFSITDTGTKCRTIVSVTSLDAVEILDESIPNITLNINKINDNSSCVTSNASIDVSIEDPTTPFTFTWKGPNGFTSTEEDLEAVAPGNYQLTVEAGCNNPPVIEATTLLRERSKVSLALSTVVSDPDNNLDPQSFSIVESPGSHAKALITSEQVLTVDYSSTTFKGIDKLTIKACDVLNACTENVINIEVIDQEGVVVYNAIAPNSTGDNKFMRIDNLPEQNRVSIFNRWGDIVFEVEQYDHQRADKRFAGFTSSGKALPTGTYLYKIEMEGNDVVTGYLSLKQ
jgi:gliding motility-associated-like protein